MKENNVNELGEENIKEEDIKKESEENIKEEDIKKESGENVKEEDVNKESEENVKEEEVNKEGEEKQEKKKIDFKNIIEKMSKKKITGKTKIAIIIGIICVVIGAVAGTTILVKNSKIEGFIFVKKAEPTKKPMITYKEYISNSKEYYYERLVVNIGKDYKGVVTLYDEIIFIKDKTNQKMELFIKKNEMSKKDAKIGLVKYVKKLNESVEYVETVEFNKNEFDIYEGIDEKGNIIKYVITANLETRILVTYTYSKEGEDEDLKHILKSMRF